MLFENGSPGPLQRVFPSAGWAVLRNVGTMDTRCAGHATGAGWCSFVLHLQIRYILVILLDLRGPNKATSTADLLRT